jgi:hypothetical protein
MAARISDVRLHQTPREEGNSDDHLTPSTVDSSGYEDTDSGAQKGTVHRLSFMVTHCRNSCQNPSHFHCTLCCWSLRQNSSQCSESRNRLGQQRDAGHHPVSSINFRDMPNPDNRGCERWINFAGNTRGGKGNGSCGPCSKRCLY